MCEYGFRDYQISLDGNMPSHQFEARFKILGRAPVLNKESRAILLAYFHYAKRAIHRCYSWVFDPHCNNFNQCAASDGAYNPQMFN